ncbi:flippase [Aeromonas veronii]|uniref:flippase n=1 Tax=Aeromonas veronii TaxID=654 RepID=UPI003F67FBA1
MENKTALNVIYNNIFIISGVLFPVLTFPYVTRVLGPEYLGVVNLAISISTIFVMLMQVGVPIYGIKAMSKTYDPEEKRTIFWSLISINIIAGCISSFFYGVFVVYSGYLSAEPLLYAMIIPSLLLGFTSVDWFFASNEDFKSIAIRTLILRAISVICLFVFVRDKNDYTAYAAIIIYGGLASNAILFFIACQKLGLRHIKIKFINIKNHVSPLKYLLFASIISALYGGFDILVLEHFWGAEFVGYYTIDRRLTLIIIALVGSFSMVLIPKMTRQISTGDSAGFQSIFSKSMVFLYALNLPVMSVLFVYSEEIIVCFAGDSFLNSVTALKILSLQVLFNSMSNLLNIQILMPLNKEKDIFNSSMVGLLVNIVIGLLLIPGYNIVGAAVALITSECVVFLLRIRVVLKSVNLPLNNECIFISLLSFGMFLCLFISKSITSGEDFYHKVVYASFTVLVVSLLYAFSVYKKWIKVYSRKH